MSYHHGNLRQALLDAATDLIEEKGLAKLSLRGVARAAGVSQTAPYHHFKDREALMAELCRGGFVELTERCVEAMKEQTDPLAAIEAMGRAYVQFATEKTPHFRIMFGNEIKDKSCYTDLTDAASSSFELLVGAVVAGQQAGAVREDDPVKLGLACWASVHGAANFVVDGVMNREKMQDKGLTTEMMVDAVTSSILRGLRPS